MIEGIRETAEPRIETRAIIPKAPSVNGFSAAKYKIPKMMVEVVNRKRKNLERDNCETVFKFIEAPSIIMQKEILKDSDEMMFKDMLREILQYKLD